jgi:hypothetical protein
MNHYGENEVQDREVLFEASANEADEYPETNEGMCSYNNFDSVHSLESDESLDRDEDLEGFDKINQVASVSTEDEQEQNDGDLLEEGGDLHTQEEESDQVEDAQMGAGTSDEVKVGPKRSKWFAEWLRQKEELFGGGAW